MAETDVFISYTHRDNWKLSDDRQGWIDRFHEAFVARLNSLCGREIRVWRDDKIGGADLLTPTIATAIQGATVLVSVLSPSYFNSEWCLRELQLFSEAAAASRGLQVGTKSRIAKVVKTPIDRKTVLGDKPELAESIGYEFYRLNPQGVPAEFDPRLGPGAYQDFLVTVNELAYGVAKLLAASGEAPPLAPIAPPSGITLYLASSSYDRTADADSIRRELEQFGHAVLPAAPIEHAPDFAERVRAQLSSCRLSIHPIGTGYGIIPEGEERSAVAIQYELAGEEAARRADFLRLPWMRASDAASDPRQQRFLASLGNDPRLVVSTIEEFKTSIIDVLKTIAAPTAQISPAARSGAARSVYMLYDRADSKAAEPVADALYEQDFDVLHPLFTGDERELREDHVENLLSCDAALIYAGEASEFWLRSKVRDLTKAAGYGRSRPFMARGVLFADPPREDKEQFRSHGVIALRGYGAFSPSVLNPFLTGVRDGGE